MPMQSRPYASRKVFAPIASGTLMALLAACGGDSSSPPPPPPPAVSVSVSVSPGTLDAGGTATLTATVLNATNTAVTWTATQGTIAGSGNTATYTAPVNGGSYSVTATSVQDATKSGSANVTVRSTAVTVTPATATLFRGEPTSFTASVSGASSTAVTWTSSCGVATPSGLTVNYMAPLSAQTCRVIATSVLDVTKADTAVVTIRGELLASASNDVDDGQCDWAHCSIREAINLANGTPAADTILLGGAASPDVPAAAQIAPLTITLTSALPTVTQDLVIVGETAETSVLDIAGSTAALRRAFDVDGATLDLRKMTVRNGVEVAGGAIFVRGGATLRTQDVRLVNNEVSIEGGAILVTGAGSQAILVRTAVDSNRTTGNDGPGGGLTITNGASLQMNGGSVSRNTVANGWGGGIRALEHGTIVLDSVVMNDNRVLAGTAGGGAILAQTSGSITLNNVTLSSNRSTGIGGAVTLLTGVTMNITGSMVRNNRSDTGGAFAVYGSQVVATDTRFEHNDAATRAGAIFLQQGGGFDITGGAFIGNEAQGPVTALSDGGAIVAAQGALVDIAGTTFEGNLAGSIGGALSVLDAATVVRVGFSTFRENKAPAGGAFIMLNGTPQLNIGKSTFIGNESVDFPGGAINAINGTLNVTESTFTGNKALGASGTRSGGAIIKQSNAQAFIATSVFSDNEATDDGGAIAAFGTGPTVIEGVYVHNNTAGRNGGGLVVGREITLRNSTVSGNTAGAIGGGVYAPAGAAPSVIQNVTLSGNTATDGGGLGVVGVLSLVNSTITANNATGLGGGLALFAGSALTLTNNILAANVGPAGPQNCGNSGAMATSGGGNLDDGTTCGALVSSTDKPNTPAGLSATLADNGGGTMTHALLAGSAAIDAAEAAACSTTDQRGYTRQGACDIGAYEFGGVAPAARVTPRTNASRKVKPRR